MVTQKRRGSALQITIIVLMVTFTLGSALLEITTGAFLRSRNDMVRAQSLDVAEAGVEKAIYYLRNTAPDGTNDATWRTSGRTETLKTAAGATVGTYTFSVQDGTGNDTGKIVIICTGTVTVGPKTTRRRLRMVITITEENISPWNNVVFGGVGQGGNSIQGNVVMRGSVHLLGDGEPYTDADGDGHWDDDEPYVDLNGNGQYDIGEPFTDLDGDGHRDAREPFTDLNGNGTWDPPLTQTDLATDIGGSANIGNNYSGMSSSMQALLPSSPTTTFGGETVQSLSAKLRVKHGRVNVDGTATIGVPNATGGSPAVKETMDGSFVSDGFGGNQGANQVYSDNGTSNGYDLQDFIHFPDVVSPETVGGVSYSSHMAYLASTGLAINGTLNLQPDQPYSVSDAYGNSLSVDGQGNVSIRGIVYVNGDINLNRGSGSSTLTYSGKGTLVATGDVYVHTNVVPASGFPATNGLGLVARHKMHLATGGGDSQLQMVGAFYAQEQVESYKQNEIAGTFVSEFFAMQNVPHMYQVPALVNNLPPGMPGSTPIWVVKTQTNSWREIAPS